MYDSQSSSTIALDMPFHCWVTNVCIILDTGEHVVHVLGLVLPIYSQQVFKYIDVQVTKSFLKENKHM